MTVILPFGYALVDALAGGTAHIDALDAFGDQVAGQRLDPFHRNGTLRIIAGVECRDHAAVFVDIFHVDTLLT